MMDIFCINNGKGLTKVDVADLEKFKDKNIWIDVNDMTKDESELLKNIFNLHPLTTEDLFSSQVRVKIEDFHDYLFCVFYTLAKSEEIELVELDFVLGKNFLISNHKRKIPSFEELKKDDSRLVKLFEKGTDFFFHRLIDVEVDNFFPILEEIDDEIETIEEEVTAKPNPKQLTRILAIKRTIVHIKKVAFQQREKIGFLTKNNYSLISKKSLPYFRDVYDHAIRVSDAIDNYREAIGNTFDAYMSAVSNSMNEVMKVLSMIATVAIPLTVISGIYGTNFDLLPGKSLAYGFWLMILLMISFSGSMIYFFRRRGWF